MSDMTRLERCRIDTPLGVVKVVGTPNAVEQVLFVDEIPVESLATAEVVAPALGGAVAACAAQILAYFAGALREFDVPLRARGTEFQRRVWDSLRAIPYGETRTVRRAGAGTGRRGCVARGRRGSGGEPAGDRGAVPPVDRARREPVWVCRGRGEEERAAGDGAVGGDGGGGGGGGSCVRGTRVRIEVAVDSVADALAAFAHGADRVEVCARLETDGVTPRVEDVRRVVQARLGPVAVMVRERADGYEASPAEVEAMAAHAAACVEAGAARVVFGVVRADGTIDENACAQITAACAGGEPVFHRVFDGLADWRGSLESLVRLGYRGLLLSGGVSTRSAGALQRLVAVRASAAGRLDLLPGGGVRADNACAVAQAAGWGWVHTSARTGGRFDPMALHALRAALDGAGASADAGTLATHDDA